MRRLLWRYLLIVFVCTGLHAQDSTATAPVTPPVVQRDATPGIAPLTFDDDLVENLQNDSDYQYIEVRVEDNWWTRFKRWLGRWWSQFWRWVLGGEVSGFWASFIRVLPYLIIAGIVVFVIWLFYKLNPGAKILAAKEEPQVYFSEEEEIIRSKDIKNLIVQAIARADYRGAVRYYYLYILKELSERELITYEFDKTNSDYLQELVADRLKEGFQKVTNLYDYIWYGNFTVTETEYRKAASAFVQLENNITSHHE
ncbi:DUF4129 domain-containing protein [Altibacter sp. HG106]|uniref:DUF4129 domain-containing protein n=1 Tax=Altibacter sp. HG106 TaxID=3023937 RepID=UPI00234FCFA7|nr:DUF4129 domain-containing protein [Altibacter sp. HG106]MDC7993839.1 DUF4129 domain-containing protein [Altibacter sp. HG106]